jgi:hypothetical protein
MPMSNKHEINRKGENAYFDMGRKKKEQKFRSEEGTTKACENKKIDL